jgi:hypothetical protein
MNLQRIEQGFSNIVAQASFVLNINNKTEHEKALDLMQQHYLNTTNIANEIAGKSLLSMILNE